MNKSQKLLAQGEAAQTPLIDLLRNVPKDGRDVYEVTPIEHHNIPYGRLCNEAADKIERQNAEIRRMVEVMEMMREALGMLDYGTRFDKATEAIAAFDAWQGVE